MFPLVLALHVSLYFNNFFALCCRSRRSCTGFSKDAVKQQHASAPSSQSERLLVFASISSSDCFLSALCSATVAAKNATVAGIILLVTVDSCHTVALKLSQCRGGRISRFML